MVNANCKFKFKNNTATELEFGFKPQTNFKSINIKFPETPTSKLFECASKVDDSVTIDTKYKIGTSSLRFNLITGCKRDIWKKVVQVNIYCIYIASTETNNTSQESPDIQLLNDTLKVIVSLK